MPGSVFRLLTHSFTTLSFVAFVRLLVLVSRSRRALAAENLFLRKQLACSKSASSSHTVPTIPRS